MSVPITARSTIADNPRSFKMPDDELIIVGFKRGTHRDIRFKAAEALLARLPQTGKFVKPQPRFLHGATCMVKKLPSAPVAVISQILEEAATVFKDEKASITIEGTTYDLTLKIPVHPDKIKRNACLRSAERYVKENAQNADGPVAICWDSGSVKIGEKSLFRATFAGEKFYYKSILDYGLTKEAFEKAVTWTPMGEGERL